MLPVLLNQLAQTQPEVRYYISVRDEDVACEWESARACCESLRLCHEVFTV
jgi:hypothetical protein